MGTAASSEATAESLVRYDWRRSYDWNYEHVPAPIESSQILPVRRYRLGSLELASPIGIAAGPLLNGRWVLYYASLGFSLLTYKTVRSVSRECYPLPNLQPVEVSRLLRSPSSPISAAADMRGSWAVSFGMPSKPPEVWRPDVEATRRQLSADLVLSVSVVASPQEDWTIDHVAGDFARCATWAVDSGADCVELNFSCPNVASCDGQLYQQPDQAAQVAAEVRAAVGRSPLVVKIGHVPDEHLAERLLLALAPHVDALVMVNCIQAKVTDGAQPLFAAEPRGIAGDAIREAAVDQVRLFNGIRQRHGLATDLVAVGGVARAEHVEACLDAGASMVQLATAAMLDPRMGIELRQQLASRAAKP